MLAFSKANINKLKVMPNRIPLLGKLEKKIKEGQEFLKSEVFKALSQTIPIRKNGRNPKKPQWLHKQLSKDPRIKNTLEGGSYSQG